MEYVNLSEKQIKILNKYMYLSEEGNRIYLKNRFKWNFFG